MFARVTLHENVDFDLADKVAQWFEATEADPFTGLPGYRGSTTLIVRDNARLVGIGFHASAGQAEEADAQLSSLYEQARDQVPEAIRPALDKRRESVGVYQLVHRD